MLHALRGGADALNGGSLRQPEAAFAEASTLNPKPFLPFYSHFSGVHN